MQGLSPGSAKASSASVGNLSQAFPFNVLKDGECVKLSMKV